MTTEQEDALETRKWRHRRYAMYVSLGSAIFVVLFLLFMAVFEPSVLGHLDSVSDIIATFVFSMTAIVATYMGSAAWTENKRMAVTRGR